MKVLVFIVASLLVNQLIIFNAQAAGENMLLRLQQSRDSDDPLDPEMSAIGAFSVTRGKVGHFDLVQLESETEGKVQGIDFGLGYTYSEGRSPMMLYLGFGLMLGYNKDQSDFVPGYYPQAGLLYFLGEGMGLTATARRLYNVYDEDTDIVTLGILLQY